jgi:glycosyltransferase involved in cell wall biosynthesis
MAAIPQVTVIVMAYNEAVTLESVVQEIGDTLASAALDGEILIVDDGSRDGTCAIADTCAAKDARVRVIHHEVNRGVGEVYRSGFFAARGALVTFLPADGQFPATVVTMMVDEAREADLVLGYLPDQQGTRSITGKLLSAAEKMFYRVLFGAMPRFQGVLMFVARCSMRYT